MNSFWRLLFLVCVCFAGMASAQEKRPQGDGLLNKLLSPGPLIQGHEDLGHKDCLRCHEPSKGVPNHLCLDCHKEIKEHIDAGKKFHGKRGNHPCVKCHTDHKGRNFDVTIFDMTEFDHTETGYELTGAHAQTDCVKCHTTKRPKRKQPKFLGQSQSCLSCHMKDDIHSFTDPKLKAKECSACHTTTSWKDLSTPFDHFKDTGYALVGAHGKVSCDKCHAPKGPDSARYKFPKLKQELCLTCHKDQHRDKLRPKFRGGACDTCHNQDVWKLGKDFKHELTGYELKGAHGKTDCASCHKQPQATPKLGDFRFVGLKQACNSCHADYHGFVKKSNQQLGPLNQCQTCHSEASWKPFFNFDHNSDTDFPLRGKHLDKKCFACHEAIQPVKPNVPRRYHFAQLATKTCETCHKDPHKGKYRQTCATCHTDLGWKKAGNFHKHNTLNGSHLLLNCPDCHGENSRVMRGAGQECEMCHRHEDPHNGTLQNCQECHKQTVWSETRFNHNMTQFPLQGAHRLTDCKSCHNRGMYLGLPSDCQSCHYTDAAKVRTPDHNDPQYSNCGQCHNQFSF